MLSLFKNIYFDNNATTKISKKVRRVMNGVLKKNYGNPSSFYTTAQHSGLILEESRKILSRELNVNETEIFFTGSATEANNQILKTLSEFYFPKKKKILSTPIEHASVMTTLEYLSQKGIQVEMIPVDSKGFVDLDQLDKMLDSDVFLICCMFANNEIGTIQNIQEISKIAHRHGVYLFSDCVQAFGKVKVDLKSLDVDYASFSAHKIHGPKGAGALFVKQGCPLSSFVHGGHQEKGFRAGTEGIHNIAGFAEAVKNIPKMLKKSNKIKDLRNLFIEKIKTLHEDIKINSPLDHCLPNTFNCAFLGVDNSELMAIFDLNGIEVSAGSACNTGENKPSHVLKAIGLSDQEAQNSIRFSFSEKTTYKEIQYVFRVLKRYYHHEYPSLNVVKPDSINDNFLSDPDLAIIDIRFWDDRKVLKSLNKAIETSIFLYSKIVKKFTKTKKIIVVCQTGKLSPMIAYKIYALGYKNTGYLMTGMLGLALTRPDLYKNHCGNQEKVS